MRFRRGRDQPHWPLAWQRWPTAHWLPPQVQRPFPGATAHVPAVPALQSASESHTQAPLAQANPGEQT